MKISNKMFTELLLLVILVFFVGCEKKGEKVEGGKPDTSQVSSMDTTSKKINPPQQKMADLTGNWKGTFDQRSATMTVIKQDGKDFNAVMNINYRQPLHKTINGTINSQDSTVKMKDLEDSQFTGQYDAQLLNNGSQMKGSFVLTRSGKSYSFSFKKQ